jgi:hypothetical protein
MVFVDQSVEASLTHDRLSRGHRAAQAGGDRAQDVVAGGCSDDEAESSLQAGTR